MENTKIGKLLGIHRDIVRSYLSMTLEHDLNARKQALNKCIEAQVYDVGIINEIAGTLSKKGDVSISFSLPISSVKNLTDYDMMPVKSDLITYQNLLTCTKHKIFVFLFIF